MKILIIEDEHKIANSIKKGLEQERYSVDVAYDGEQGFDIAMSSGYSVIILDLMLPKMSGIEVCNNLRSEGNHTPILILTAKGQVGDKVEGLDSGADDYLVKPFAFTELLARIKALSRRPKQIQDEKLMVGDLVIDTRNFFVTRASKEIQLSKKEYELLEYLIRHKGKTIGKDVLINNVWDYDNNILPNTVEVYIGYLRNKIDKPFKKSKSIIHTVRGFGYKVD